MVCSWKQIILLTMFACNFVSVIILGAFCVCDCVVWLVFTAGCFAVRQLILGRRELAYGDRPAFGVGKLKTAQH